MYVNIINLIIVNCQKQLIFRISASRWGRSWISLPVLIWYFYNSINFSYWISSLGQFISGRNSKPRFCLHRRRSWQAEVAQSQLSADCETSQWPRQHWPPCRLQSFKFWGPHGKDQGDHGEIWRRSGWGVYRRARIHGAGCHGDRCILKILEFRYVPRIYVGMYKLVKNSLVCTIFDDFVC